MQSDLSIEMLWYTIKGSEDMYAAGCTCIYYSSIDPEYLNRDDCIYRVERSQDRCPLRHESGYAYATAWRGTVVPYEPDAPETCEPVVLRSRAPEEDWGW